MIKTQRGTVVETFREKEELHKDRIMREGKIGVHGNFIRHRKHRIPSWRWKGKYRSLRNVTRKHMTLAQKMKY